MYLVIYSVFMKIKGLHLHFFISVSVVVYCNCYSLLALSLAYITDI